jgi:acyl carrier protein
MEDKIADFIKREILKNPGFDLPEDEALISSGLIDSFSLVDLALFVEDTFGVRVEDTELASSTFDTISELAELVRKRQVS